MSNILYLVHRLPYPPNKGDKVRSYHLLKHLAARHRVFLGTFMDDPQDAVYIDKLPQFCADMHIARLSAPLAKMCSLRGLLTNEALTLPYYRDLGLQNWVRRTLREQKIDAAVVFSSSMAQYLQQDRPARTLVDFVDVDSAKWSQYADKHRWPLSWLYRREGRRLLAYEREVAQWANHAFFVTDNETELFCRSAPECTGRVDTMCNGVDADFFAPSPDLASPYAAQEVALVFSGAMDYWPNIDAVSWFVGEILPGLLKNRPELRFYIVGRNPSPAVQALAGKQVVVTGTVPDVRPYLQYAAVGLAPLRVARGIQNKVLEAMAMALPVVASRECAAPIEAQHGEDFLTAGPVQEYHEQIEYLLAHPERARAMGQAARARVLANYSWDAHLAKIDRCLTDPGSGGQGEPPS